MQNNGIPESELVLNNDGSVYHLHVRDKHIADTVIVVGDPGRVQKVSSHFEKIECRIQNREFNTHTGTYKGKRLTVLSTGIGTDNIDIAINELDAAVNIDPASRTARPQHRKLSIVRIGTSGALQPDVPVGTQVISEFGLGLDGLMHYYHFEPNAVEKELTGKINEHLHLNENLPRPYIVKGSESLMKLLGQGMMKGITATASGFYGPQGRKLTLSPRDPDINQRLQSFSYKEHRILNFEMETSALYGLGRLLHHECVTCCVIIANRIRKEFSDDHIRDTSVLIETVLSRLVNGNR